MYRKKEVVKALRKEHVKFNLLFIYFALRGVHSQPMFVYFNLRYGFTKSLSYPTWLKPAVPCVSLLKVLEFQGCTAMHVKKNVIILNGVV